MALFVVTANLTREGVSVFLRIEDGRRIWSARIEEATVVEGKEQADRLVKEAEPDLAATLVVGTYHFEVELKDGTPVPATARERIRAARKPTIPFGPK